MEQLDRSERASRRSARKAIAIVAWVLVLTSLFPSQGRPAGATSTATIDLTADVAVDVAITPAGDVYVLDRFGRIHATGNAPYFGGVPLLAVDESAVALMLTATGAGYWIVTSQGRVIPYGDAAHHDDVAGIELTRPIIDAAPTPSGAGYHLLGADGGVFAFGDAQFHGSIPEVIPVERLAAPIVAIASTARGYWLVGADGGVFAFGDAGFHGSIPGVLGPGRSLDEPVVAAVAGRAGYLVIAADGGVFAFGDVAFHGSRPGVQARLALRNVAKMAAVAVSSDGYVMLDGDGGLWPFGDAPNPGTPAMASYFAGIAPRIAPAWVLARTSAPGDVVDCADFAWRGDAQRWFDLFKVDHRDPANLDPNGDGLVCLELPHGASAPEPFGPGPMRVGVDIAAGTYRASGSVGCSWEATSGRDGELVRSGSFTVVRLLADAGVFTSTPGCGTWTPVSVPVLGDGRVSSAAPIELAEDQSITLLAGAEMARGLWRVESTDPRCHVRPLRGFGSIGSTPNAWIETIGPLDEPVQTLVEVLGTDAGVHIEHCSALRLVDGIDAVPQGAAFGTGWQVVGVDIEAGTWRSTSTASPDESCWWGRLANFAPDSQYHHIATGSVGFHSPTATVTIEPTDRGFASSASCGGWVRITD